MTEYYLNTTRRKNKLTVSNSLIVITGVALRLGKLSDVIPINLKLDISDRLLKIKNKGGIDITSSLITRCGNQVISHLL